MGELYLFSADLKQMGPPLCVVVLLKVSSWFTGSFFLAPVAIVLTLRGFRHWALWSTLRHFFCFGAMKIKLSWIEYACQTLKTKKPVTFRRRNTRQSGWMPSSKQFKWTPSFLIRHTQMRQRSVLKGTSLSAQVIPKWMCSCNQSSFTRCPSLFRV